MHLEPQWQGLLRVAECCTVCVVCVLLCCVCCVRVVCSVCCAVCVCVMSFSVERIAEGKLKESFRKTKENIKET